MLHKLPCILVSHTSPKDSMNFIQRSLLARGAAVKLSKQVQNKYCVSALSQAQDDGKLQSSDHHNKQNRRVTSLEDNLRKRQEQTERMLLVAHVPEHASAMLSYCRRFGAVSRFVTYPDEPRNDNNKSSGSESDSDKAPQPPPPNLTRTLIEFKQKSSCRQLLRSSHIDHGNTVNSRCLYFKYPQKISPKASPLKIQTGKRELDKTALANAESLTAQLEVLYNHLRLSNDDLRLRFLLLSEVRSAVQTILPHASVSTYGSLASGLSRQGSDIDVVIHGIDTINQPVPGEGSMCYSRKSPNHVEILHVVHSYLRCLYPQFREVYIIPRAQVPIVKCTHSTGVHIDISIGSNPASTMSQILYHLGATHPLFRPLVTCIKHWATEAGVTKPNPGPWPSSFTLNMLIVYFLQAGVSPAVLPPLKALGPQLDMKELMIPGSTDLPEMPEHSHTLGDLFQRFLQFYESFDFSQGYISVLEGQLLPFSEEDPAHMHIENPLEPSRNVSQNVNALHVQRLQLLCRVSKEMLQYSSKQGTWGLLRLLEECQGDGSKDYRFNLDLFEAETAAEKTLAEGGEEVQGNDDDSGAKS